MAARRPARPQDASRPRARPAKPRIGGTTPGPRSATPKRTTRARSPGSIRPTSGRPSTASGSTTLLIVGDAFARPLLDELDRGDLRPATLTVLLLAAAAPLSPPAARASCSSTSRPSMIVDGLGSSEAGGQGVTCRAGTEATTGTFAIAGAPMCCRATDRRAARARRRRARLAGQERPRAARLPGRPGQDARATFPVIDGVRYAVPGDRARLRGRRRGRAARARLGHDQLRRREDLRRGGRGGAQGPPRRVRLRRRRAAERAVGPGGRGRGAAAPRRRRPTTATLLAEAEQHIARYKLPEGVRLRRRGRALARRARPTTAGPARRPTGAPPTRRAPEPSRPRGRPGVRRVWVEAGRLAARSVPPVIGSAPRTSHGADLWTTRSLSTPRPRKDTGLPVFLPTGHRRTVVSAGRIPGRREEAADMARYVVTLKDQTREAVAGADAYLQEAR